MTIICYFCSAWALLLPSKKFFQLLLVRKNTPLKFLCEIFKTLSVQKDEKYFLKLKRYLLWQNILRWKSKFFQIKIPATYFSTWFNLLYYIGPFPTMRFFWEIRFMSFDQLWENMIDEQRKIYESIFLERCVQSTRHFPPTQINVNQALQEP